MGSDDLRERVQRAVENYGCIHPADTTPLTSDGRCSRCSTITDAVLDALGLEQVGRWCSTCREWRNNIGCGVCGSRTEPVYRLAAPSSSEGVGDGE